MDVIERSTSSDEKSPPFPIHAMVRTFALDLGLPMIAYYASTLLGAGTYISLLLGAAMAGARLVWVSVRQRTVEPFSLCLMLLFGADIALSVVTGDARFILMKDSALSGVAAVILIGSCVIGRPIAYYAAKKFHAEAGNADFDDIAGTDRMRARWNRVSSVWGVGLLIDSVLRVVVVYMLPIGTAAVVSQALMIAAYVVLIAWTVHSAKEAATQST